MTKEHRYPAQRDLHHGHFSEGLDDRDHFPEDDRVGRFSTGLEQLAPNHEQGHQGRFSEGEELLPEEDPEKHVERRFSEGLEHIQRDAVTSR